MVSTLTKDILDMSLSLSLNFHFDAHNLTFITEYPTLLVWAWGLLIFFDYRMRMKVRLESIGED